MPPDICHTLMESVKKLKTYIWIKSVRSIAIRYIYILGRYIYPLVTSVVILGWCGNGCGCDRVVMVVVRGLDGLAVSSFPCSPWLFWLYYLPVDLFSPSPSFSFSLSLSFSFILPVHLLMYKCFFPSPTTSTSDQIVPTWRVLTWGIRIIPRDRGFRPIVVS